HRGLQRRLDGLVALPRLLVLLIALDLGLDIRHAEASLRFWFSSVGAGGFRTRGSPTTPRRGATLRRGRISQPKGRAQTGDRARGPAQPPARSPRRPAQLVDRSAARPPAAPRPAGRSSARPAPAPLVMIVTFISKERDGCHNHHFPVPHQRLPRQATIVRTATSRA